MYALTRSCAERPDLSKASTTVSMINEYPSLLHGKSSSVQLHGCTCQVHVCSAVANAHYVQTRHANSIHAARERLHAKAGSIRQRALPCRGPCRPWTPSAA